MKYFSTFSGIGGFELGIGKKHKCVGFSEIDKYAQIIYNKHFNHQAYGNITKISTDTLPDFDLLCGGFPCQAFSIAGKRGGFDDTRGTLFFELARIARAKRPKYLFFENVKGLLSHDGGKTFDTIIRTIDELGYDCQWQVLNSKNFGVPQNRERVFIIGHLRGTPRPKVFPFGENSEENTMGVEILGTSIGKENTRIGERDQIYSSNGIMGTLKATDYKQPPQILNLTPLERQGNRVYSTDGISQTLAAQTGGKGGKTGLYAVGMGRQKNAGRMEELSPTIQTASGGGGGRPLVAVTAVPLKFLDRNQKNYQGDYSFTVDTANTGGVMQDMKIRRLTPIECERLQGFPDGWTEGISDSQRYKCLGNAITVNVIKAIADRLLT